MPVCPDLGLLAGPNGAVLLQLLQNAGLVVMARQPASNDAPDGTQQAMGVAQPHAALQLPATAPGAATGGRSESGTARIGLQAEGLDPSSR